MRLNADQAAAIESQRKNSFPTRRATAPALEDILFEAIPVLDRGFIRIIDYMGNDQAITQAARVSYGSGTKHVSSDKGLISYLLRNSHTSPFEMCEIKLHVKLPIFVARQWLRHRTANLNEYSARYSVLDREFYIPDAAFLNAQKNSEKDEQTGQQSLFSENVDVQSLAGQSKTNKQGREEETLGSDEATATIKRMSDISNRAFNVYDKLLGEDDQNGIARELARTVLPVSTYTQMYWKIDLHNLLHFVSLRADHHAQYEIRAYADIIHDIIKKWVPFTAEAFENYRLKASSISMKGLAVINDALAGKKVSRNESGLSKSEWDALVKVLPALGGES